MTATSVLVVDDHGVVASAVAVALRANGFDPVVVVDSTDLSADAVLDAARREQPDIVLLDLYLGRELTSLPMIGPLITTGARVLLFTSSTDARLLAAGLRAGAEAVVDKSTSFDQVLATLQRLGSGEPAMTHEERAALLEELEGGVDPVDDHRRFDLLTPRESQVLHRLIEGDSPKGIAHSEGISVSTVRGHIERILAKLDVNNQREALALARVSGWPPSETPHRY